MKNRLALNVAAAMFIATALPVRLPAQAEGPKSWKPAWTADDQLQLPENYRQ
jgi:hypothetical protein